MAPNRRPLLFLFIGLCLLFAVTYAARLGERGEVEAQIADAQVEIEAAERRQARLEAERAQLDGEGAVAQIARDELEMAKEGDTVLVVITPVASPTPVPAVVVEPETERQEPVWRQWLGLFWDE